MRRQFRQNTAEWRRVLDECLVLFEVLGSVVPSSQEQKPGALHYRGLGIRHNQLVLASRVNHVRAHLRRRACNQHVPQKSLTMGSPEHTWGAVLSPRFVCSSLYSHLWMPVYRLKAVSLATAFIPVWALYCKKIAVPSPQLTHPTHHPPATPPRIAAVKLALLFRSCISSFGVGNPNLPRHKQWGLSATWRSKLSGLAETLSIYSQQKHFRSTFDVSPTSISGRASSLGESAHTSWHILPTTSQLHHQES